MTERLDAGLPELSVAAKCAFLARVAHEQTVHARAAAYVPGTDEADGRRLRHFNEFLHRLTGSLMAVAEGRDSDRSWEYAIALITSHNSSNPDRLAELKTWLRKAATTCS